MRSPQPHDLNDDDLAPLLQAAASRSLDTCLRGARCLAVLGDPRAFGLLLQLSRENDAPARADVCRALAELDDPRAIDRLRSLLFDPEPPVRDAAFSALARLQAREPLRSAEAGLNATFEDVRRRGLQVLVATLKAAPDSAPARELLARALNDSFPGVRGEAWKSALNLQIDGGGIRTLRFALQSLHADVRREVLTEVMAQVQEPWAWELLLEFYNDHEPRLREEAFTFAVRKNKELPPLEAALRSQYPDVRRLAVDALIKKHTAAAQALLVRALSDADKDVRQHALGALVGEDARGALTEALASPHADVRGRAAGALARHGDLAALAPLLALATVPEPELRERQADWLALVESALDGLAELGEPSARTALVPLLKSPHAAVRKGAAKALAWVTLPHHGETLGQALQHDDPQVKYRAALGLAYAGDPLAASLVFSAPAGQVLSRDEQLVAAFGLGPAGEDQLTVFLDDDDESLRTRALVLLMLLELKAPKGGPVRCLRCLSARPPRARLTAARALEAFADPGAFRDFVVQLFNDRGDEPAGKVSAETVNDVAELLANGPPVAKARTAHLLKLLAEKEPAAWEQAWALHAARFAAQIGALRESARERPAPERQYTAGQLQEMAFGAYVGLVREQGGSSGGGRGTEAQVIRVRQTALGRVRALAASAGQESAVRTVLVQALGDPNQAVRLQAFDELAALGVSADALGAAALGAGHTDVAVRGLEALAGGGTSAEGQAVLEDAMRSRTDQLAVEAAKLLIARRSLVPVAGLALGAAFEPLRQQAVAWLASEYDKGPEAVELLRQALTSRHRRVSEAAALELGLKKDLAAFDALRKHLAAHKEEDHQRTFLAALGALGDARAAGAFLDLVEREGATTLAGELLAAAGSFRRPETADRLLALAEKKEEWRDPALRAVLTVSGYDQGVPGPEEDEERQRPPEPEHPRHDAVLARLMERGIALRQPRLLAGLTEPARWARGKEVGPPLATLSVHADNNLRHSAIQALGWRLRKRGGPAEPLLAALKQRDPVAQFLAAEGLGRAGRAEGLSPLLAAVELQEDAHLRQRAVRALGELGDARALDLLLKLANDPEHALRPTAAEALGHIGRSEKADEVLTLLAGLAGGPGPLAESALKGLRWLDHPEGWQLIRRRAADERWPYQPSAIDLLGHHDDQATRDLLLRLLAEAKNYHSFVAALTASRRLWGPESLEPDYAAAQHKQSGPTERDEVLRRLRERGDARRLLEVLPKLSPEVAGLVKGILLGRKPLPVAEARVVVVGPDAMAAGVAAHLLGRAGDEASSAGPDVASALGHWWAEWDKARQEEARRGAQAGTRAGPLTGPLRSLVWAAGRLGVGADTLRTIATTRSETTFDRPLRREAVAALAAGKATKEALAALELLAVGDDPEVRALAAQAVARHDANRAEALAGRVLMDRVTFNRLAAHAPAAVAGALRQAAAQQHYQGVAVPHLAARRDVEALTAVIGNRSLPDDARLGAVEGLAAASAEAAEAELVRFGLAKDEPEELRKAAWRGLRRSRRARARAAAGKEGPS